MPKKIEKCSGCDEDLRPGWKFCANCGAVIISLPDVSDSDFASLKSSSTDTR